MLATAHVWGHLRALAIEHYDTHKSTSTKVNTKKIKATGDKREEASPSNVVQRCPEKGRKDKSKRKEKSVPIKEQKDRARTWARKTFSKVQSPINSMTLCLAAKG